MLEKVDSNEYLNSGHLACPGCGASLSIRHALKALGKQTIVIIPPGCSTLIGGLFPKNSLYVPILNVPFATAAACASGVSRSLKQKGKNEVQVMVWAGDGATFDIGLQALSGAADRKEDFIFVCYDNEAYMNTGNQQSSATPPGSWTTTTPSGKNYIYEKKDMVGIIRDHRPAYLATASVAYTEDFYNKFLKAKEKKGFRFIHLHSVCPPGWRINSQDALKVSRLAVESGAFPLLEMDGKSGFRQTYIPQKPVSVKTYLKSQGRFRKLKQEDIQKIQEMIIEQNQRLFGQIK